MTARGLGLCLLGAAAMAAGGASAEPAARPTAGIERRIGAQVPLAARFTASDGREVTLGDALGSGKPALVVLAYNRCSMLCSLVLRSVAGLLADFELRPGDQFSLVTISIDPSDTVLEASRMQEALLDGAGLTGQRHRWRFLVGQRAEIDAVADALGFGYAWDPDTGQYDHPAVLITLAAGGKVSGYFDGLSPDRAALREALDGRAGTIAGATLEDVILNCFRFDTSQSRYGGAIRWALRAGAASLIIALGALLWWLGRGTRGGLGARP